MPGLRRNATPGAVETANSVRTNHPPDTVTFSKRSSRHHSFSRNSRLTDTASFNQVFKNARRSRDNYFTVLYRSSDRSEPRLGLAIAKKHCKLATGRNRIKRLVRESFREHKTDLQGFDIVVMNTPATHAADNGRLFDSLERSWNRVARSRPGGRQD